MNKTAIEEGIEQLKEQLMDIRSRYGKPNQDKNDSYIAAALTNAISIFNNLLPTEQQQIEEAYNAGVSDAYNRNNCYNNYSYFTQTYKDGEN